MKFKSRREAKDWCAQQHPGSPIEEIGPCGVPTPGEAYDSCLGTKMKIGR